MTPPGWSSLSNAEREAYCAFNAPPAMGARLEREGLATVGELRAWSEEQLREFWGVGPKIIADISLALQDPVLRAADSLVRGAPDSVVNLRARRGLIRIRRQGVSLLQLARSFDISRERGRQIPQRDGWCACAARPDQSSVSTLVYSTGCRRWVSAVWRRPAPGVRTAWARARRDPTKTMSCLARVTPV